LKTYNHESYSNSPHGGLEVLQSTTLPDPTPEAGEVLVRVKASAVNPLDGIVRMGYFPIAAKPPLILGEEASGLTERDGAGFKAGEKVIVYGGGLGVFRDGTWADLVAVPATSVRKLPEGISFEEGAALSNVGVTAYGAIRHGGLKAGETLLVLGATGGVGSAGIQLGKALGARVIAVGSAAKLDRLSPLLLALDEQRDRPALAVRRSIACLTSPPSSHRSAWLVRMIVSEVSASFGALAVIILD
jgi:NADPH:quinone reductase-like Zn-dependent oxidoreductase